jgi:hypothetical protein
LPAFSAQLHFTIPLDNKKQEELMVIHRVFSASVLPYCQIRVWFILSARIHLEPVHTPNDSLFCESTGNHSFLGSG